MWFDLTDNIRNFRKKGERRRGMFKILTLNSKVALTMTAILIVTGTVSFLFLEFSNPDTLGEFSFGDKVMGAAFQSVTTRTAGFFTVPPGRSKRRIGVHFLSSDVYRRLPRPVLLEG